MTTRILTSIAVLLLFFACNPKTAKDNDSKSTKINGLLSEMTLEEKIGQLNMYTGSWEFTGPVPADASSKLKAQNIREGLVGGMLNVLGADAIRAAQKMAVENSRLGIPLIFGYDVIHGYKTMAPIPLGQAASFDTEVARKCAELAAYEASSTGINWTFAPMVDIVRDARWGRMMESPGEDPFLAAAMSKAWVKGFQGDDLANVYTIAACVKHFAAYGFAEAGRDYNTVDISDNTLYNMVLPPFKAAAEIGAATFMNAFNEVGGIPATASVKLQRDLLKGDWNWDGFIVSDWGTIGELIIHGFAKDSVEAARIALIAGSDMDMESNVYITSLSKAIADEPSLVEKLDDAVRRILGVKYDLGLFDDPYRYCDVQKEKENLLTQATLDAVRDAGRKSMVLLKNEDKLLPLAKEGIKIGVIGSLANSKDIPLGSWRAQVVENSGVSLLEGVQSAVGAKNVFFAEGYRLTKGERNFRHELTIIEDDQSGFQEAIDVAKKVDVIILALGEDCWQSGEGRSQTDIGLKGSQEALLMELLKVNPKVVVTLMNGRSLAIPEVAASAPAILETWHAGSEAGNAIADVLFGDYNPSAKLPVSFPRNVGQLPIYYNHKNTGRPGTNDHDAGMVFWSHYTDSPNSPLYPFGYGLSYTKFEYSDLNLSSDKIESSGEIDVTVRLSNIGEYDGTEIVQLYIRDHVGSVTRPVKELKGFEKVFLKAGETKEVSFTIDKRLLSYYQADLTFGVEPGEFTVYVGTNSRKLMEKTFELL